MNEFVSKFFNEIIQYKYIDKISKKNKKKAHLFRIADYPRIIQ